MAWHWYGASHPTWITDTVFPNRKSVDPDLLFDLCKKNGLTDYQLSILRSTITVNKSDIALLSAFGNEHDLDTLLTNPNADIRSAAAEYSLANPHIQRWLGTHPSTADPYNEAISLLQTQLSTANSLVSVLSTIAPDLRDWYLTQCENALQLRNAGDLMLTKGAAWFIHANHSQTKK